MWFNIDGMFLFIFKMIFNKYKVVMVIIRMDNIDDSCMNIYIVFVDVRFAVNLIIVV